MSEDQPPMTGSYMLTAANVDANGCYKGPPELQDPTRPFQGDVYIPHGMAVNFNCNGKALHITGDLVIL